MQIKHMNVNAETGLKKVTEEDKRLKREEVM